MTEHMSIPVVDVAQMRRWEEATWATGQSEEAVIRRVGELVARRALALTRDGDGILILAGPGNNGADARRAQPHLAQRQTEMLVVADPAAGAEAVRAALASGPALVLDGLFGIGLNRNLSTEWMALVEQVNGSRVPVLAIDVPSGLNAQTGEVMGAAIRADLTLTLGAPKRGLLAVGASPYVGRLEVAPHIGLVPCPLTSDLHWTSPADFARFPPPRAIAGHKGVFGHAVLLAGSLGYHGAAVLAARGAQRARPGLVSLFTTQPVYPVVAGQMQAVMTHIWFPDTAVPEHATALLCGPGLAERSLPAELGNELRNWWDKSPLPVVVDASALDWLREGWTKTNSIRVITPHPGEAARMLRTSVATVQGDRPAAVRELSRRYGGCWVVLKGYQTLLGSAEGDLYVNPSGDAHLAQGGSGDVLAGYVVGLLAQPALQADPLLTLRYAVWQHGATADALSGRQANWTVEELVAALGNVLALTLAKGSGPS